MSETRGAVYTPSNLANLMTNWAVRSTEDKILDLGIGEGVFVYSCYQKLVALGATAEQAENQIYGAEIDETTFNSFMLQASNLGVTFPHLICNDFFQSQFPQVDVIIGNPPYIRRSQIPSEHFEKIRKSVLEMNVNVDEQDLSHLTDLYVYFLLRATPLLRLEGRLAIIAADSWLNVRYGRILKHHLKNHFELERFISFDRSIFANAQVKPVVLLATKKAAPSPNSQVAFTRAVNGLSAEVLPVSFEETNSKLERVNTLYIPAVKLDEKKPWGIHFKISEISNLLESNRWMVPIGTIAQTRIGLQTLAKDFFILSPEEAQRVGVEPEFLEPVAESLAQFSSPTIDNDTEVTYKLFFCSKPKCELGETKALEYILNGETREVSVRGKGQTVIGYHNKERIKQANRLYWYDVKSEVDRRGRAPILIPRLIYRHYCVLWNRARFIPGGAVIEFIPKDEEIDIRVFLAVLNSTLMEVLIRGYAQMYGGGTYTVGLSEIKSTPIIDVPRLNKNVKNSLIKAYEMFIKSGNRDKIDDIIWTILRLDGDLFEEAAGNLRLMAVSAKKKSA